MKRLIATAAMALSLLAAAPQKTSTDDQLVDQVRLRLAGDPMVNGGALDVDVKDGNVVLKGKVKNDKARQKAAVLAKKVKGVKAVDNQLQVDPNAH